MKYENDFLVVGCRLQRCILSRHMPCMSSREEPSLPEDNVKSKGFGNNTDLKCENLALTRPTK